MHELNALAIILCLGLVAWVMVCLWRRGDPWLDEPYESEEGTARTAVAEQTVVPPPVRLPIRYHQVCEACNATTLVWSKDPKRAEAWTGLCKRCGFARLDFAAGKVLELQ